MIVPADFRGHDWSAHDPAPFEAHLNTAIMAIASIIFPTGFEASEDAPDTYEKLKARLDAGHRMIVWSGGSDATVFGAPVVNWAFRAWHDWCHWHGEYPFTLDGEKAACAMQCDQLVALYGDTPRIRRWQQILDADIVGQWHYQAETGRFPADQRLFVLSALRQRDRATALVV